MKKKQLTKRMAAVLLAAVMAFSTVGEGETLMAAEPITVNTEAVENESAVTETMETEESETTEAEALESTESSEIEAIESKVQEELEVTEVESTEEESTETETEIDIKADDGKDTISEAMEVTVGKTVKGGLNSSEDVDYFKFTTDGTDSFYSVTFSNICETGALEYAVYSSEDETDASKIADVYCYQKTSKEVNLEKLEKNHTYYIRIFNGYGNSGGNYAFILEKAEDDIKDSAAEAAEVLLNTEVSKKINNVKDVDYFKFTTDGTDSFYTFTFSNVGMPEYAEYVIYSDEDELKCIAGHDYCWPKETCNANLLKLEKNHTYYIKIFSHYSNCVGDYKFIVKKAEDDVKDTMTEASDIVVDMQIRKRIDNEADTDCFKFTTDGTDSFYTFSVSNVDVAGDISYYIYSDENELNEIACDTYIPAKNTNTVNLKKLEKNHTYYVKISGRGGEGNYEFIIKKAKDDVSDTVASAKTLGLNETKTFTLQNAVDVDCFKFKTTTYTDYNLNFSNVNSEDNVIVRVYSGKDCLDNQLVLEKWVGKKNSLSTTEKKLKLKTGKTYYVVISGSCEGKYKLGIDAAAPQSTKTKSASKKVTITWKKVTKATGYEVYRATSRDGKYKKITTIKKNSTVKYVDSKGLKKGKTYYYKVRAYKKSGSKTYYSAYSAVKSVKVK